jgi:hypothetical protein
MDIPCIISRLRVTVAAWVSWVTVVYMVYPSPWKYMVHHLMYIHGICVVYPWIFLNMIPSFLKPDFAAGPPAPACCCQVSSNAHTWVIKSVLFHAPPWQSCQGKRRPTKVSTRLPPTFPLCRLLRRWRPLRRRRCRGQLSVFSLVTLVAGNDLNLGERWGRGSLPSQGRWPMCWTAKILACAEKNLFEKAVDHVQVMNLKNWIECSLQLNWILKVHFHLVRKQQTHDNAK